MNNLHYAQLLSSKICHDLITPISAINSGLELLEDNDTSRAKDVIGLVKQSSDTSIRRLVFFRAIFGSSAMNSFSSVEPAENILRQYLEPVGITPVLKAEFDNTEKVDFPLLSRWILNISYIISELSNGKSQLSIEIGQKNKDLNATISLIGDHIFEMKTETIMALKGEVKDEDLSPHNIHAYFTYELCQKLDIELHIEQSTNQEFRCSASKKEHHMLYSGTLF